MMQTLFDIPAAEIAEPSPSNLLLTFTPKPKPTSGMMALRPYQQDCIDAVISAYMEDGLNRQLVVLSTGLGKTIIFSTLTKLLDVHTLILAHRDELIQQAKDKLLSVWPDADIGIVKGNINEIGHKVTIASVQTLRSEKRFKQAFPTAYNIKQVRLVICDESHHLVAPSYRTILKQFGLHQKAKPDGRNSPLFLGVTATPLRGDKMSYRDLVDKEEPTYIMTVGDGIEQGYLVPTKGYRLLFDNEKFKGVRIQRGDFVTADLKKVVTRNVARNEEIVRCWHQQALGKQTVVFCVDKEHAEVLTKVFLGAGIKADYVHDSLSSEQRKRVLSEFESGKITVICNVMILTEGWDCPFVECVIMARPTKNQSLYIQAVGRGLRLSPSTGKTHCLVIDVADVSHDIGGLDAVISLGRLKEVTISSETGTQQGPFECCISPVPDDSLTVTGGITHKISLNIPDSLASGLELVQGDVFTLAVYESEKDREIARASRAKFGAKIYGKKFEFVTRTEPSQCLVAEIKDEDEWEKKKAKKKTDLERFHIGEEEFDPLENPFKDASGCAGQLWWSPGALAHSLVLEVKYQDKKVIITDGGVKREIKVFCIVVKRPDGLWDIVSQKRLLGTNLGGYPQWVVHAEKFVNEAGYSTQKDAVKAAENYALSLYPGVKRFKNRTASWRQLSASQAQLDYLAKFLKPEKLVGVHTSGQAAALIDQKMTKSIKPLVERKPEELQ